MCLICFFFVSAAMIKAILLFYNLKKIFACEMQLCFCHGVIYIDVCCFILNRIEFVCSTIVVDFCTPCTVL